MKKKIVLPLLLIIFSLLLVSCLELPITNNSEIYKSTDSYEQKLISATDNIKKQTVSLTSNQISSRPNSTVGSATIIKKERDNSAYLYYAITHSSFLNDKSLKVYIPNGRTEEIEKYAVNIKYDIAIIVFYSRTNLEVANFEKDGLPVEVIMGQTVVSNGLDSNNNYPATTKEGFITNNEVFYNNMAGYFSHDISNNAGEIGTGVYNLEGTLLGINMEIKWYDYNKSSNYNILGVNYALKISEIHSLLNNLNLINFDTKIIENELVIGNQNELSKYQLDNYEELINDIYINKQGSIVKIKNLSVLQSGIIINKEDNTYEVLTITIKEELKKDLKVEASNNTYDIKEIMELSDLITIIKFESDLDYQVERLRFNPTLTRGQTLVTISSLDQSLINSINVGVLSKPDSEFKELFMHSTKANDMQIGSPIFNLNGNLVGLHTGKINSVETQTGEIVAEALSYSLKITEIGQLLDINLESQDYQASGDYERTIIEVTKNVLNKTVTVKTDTGHGSGVIFKREKISNNSYIYSVLTNQHVISKVENNKILIRPEISVTFNNNLRSIRIKDVYANSSYDLAVLRFESSERIEVVESEAMNNGKQTEPVLGQVVIALGTPEQVKRTGYVTTGIFTSGPNSYQNQSSLGLLTSVPLNPGNSGGPLFNLKGELIGLNVAKATNLNIQSGEVFIERISISLNINKIAQLYNSTIVHQPFFTLNKHQARIGITISEINEFIMFNPKLKDLVPESTHGLVIVDVDDLFDAFGKFEIYDVIVEINGKRIISTNDVSEIIKNQSFGFKLKVKVLRLGEASPIEIEVELS